MSRLNGKASQVLDAILSSESPEVRAKVYEIINVSGLEADDPMFLILALTGQIRVFLEAAPAELSMLLTEWKAHSARSLSEIYNAIERIKDTQQQQADSLAENLEIVSDKCVSDIKEAGMATTSAIAEANSETLAQARQARNETEQLKLASIKTAIENLIESVEAVEDERNEYGTFYRVEGELIGNNKA